MKNLSTRPVKGFRDFPPEEWAIQKYIFDAWESVCRNYGFEEYNGPVLEDINIYNKSGADVGTFGSELYQLTDRGDRKLALRPEMTPTVGRMVAEYEKNYPKPIRWFSIAQFFRAENPQRGRGREFFQLNTDIFGDDSVYSDFEVICIAIDIMKRFGATPEMFTVRINNRKLTDYYFKNILKIEDPDLKVSLMRIIDAAPKKSADWFESEVLKIVSKETYDQIVAYLKLSVDDLEGLSNESAGASELQTLFEMLKKSERMEYCRFDTGMSRGFDYYTGMVFEVFDNNPENRRSMFGGGRYDDLLDIFAKPKVPAVGFAPGDITTRLFLESWGLLKSVNSTVGERYYAPLLYSEAHPLIVKIADNLREQGKAVQVGFKLENISKALSYSNKLSANKVLIIGEEEFRNNIYKVKDMDTGLEETFQI